MSAKRTERLLNLVIALLSTRRGFTKHELFEEIELYREAPTAEAREKLFDRDKAFLREQGIPVESYSDEPLFESDNTVSRYRIRPDAYRLPGVRFTAGESAVLALAARMWDQASLGSAAARALRKLQARGVLTEDTGGPVQPSIRTNDPHFDDALRAALERRPVSFGYRSGSGTAESVRHVQPWGMGSRFGHWYLVGWDLDRGAERIFRLSRMTTAVRFQSGSYCVPAGFDIDHSLAALGRVFAPQQAEVDLRPGSGAALRLTAGAAVSGPDAAGWERLSLTVQDLDALAADTAALGSSARAVHPPEFRSAVKAALDGTLAAHRSPLPPFELAEPARQSRTQQSAQTHLTRLLDLVPWILNNQGADMEATAAKFGVSREQLANDLNLLFVSGPRHYPNGLMDVSFDNDQIYIDNATDLSEPVRLGADEATALIVGLDALAALPGVGSTAPVASALEKLTEAAGESARAGAAVAAHLGGGPETGQLLEALQEAIAGRRRLTMRYLVPRRDELTDRVIDPRRLFSVNDTWYLDAWCHRAEAPRNFRVDRIYGIQDDGPAAGTPEAGDAGFPASLFTPGPDDVRVTLVLEPSALWVADAYDAERSAGLPDGRTAVELRVADPGWIPGFAARLGGAAVVAAPEELRLEVMAQAERALRNYSR